MFITLINDCHCSNARGRQETRLATLLGSPINFVKVNSDLEAAGNLIDILDAGLGGQGVVLVNVAPRNGKASQWKNGSPFGFFYYKKTLVISTISGYTLSLVKKLNLTSDIKEVDLEKTFQAEFSQKEYLQNSQFRSFEFLPRLAKQLLKKKTVVAKLFSLQNIPDIGSLVWWIDNFGNIKTSVVTNTLEYREIKKKLGQQGFQVKSKLNQASEKQVSLITGSSGIEEKRFLEIVINGQSAAQKLKVKVGDEVKKIKLKK